MPIAGATYTDSGSGTCHGPPSPTAKPGRAVQRRERRRDHVQRQCVVGPAGRHATHLRLGLRRRQHGHRREPDAQLRGRRQLHGDAHRDGLQGQRQRAGDDDGDDRERAARGHRVGHRDRGPARRGALALSVSDPGPDDAPWAYSIDWGDGSAASTGSISTQGTPTAVTHVYTTPGQYSGVATVTDKDGGVGTDGFSANVGDPLADQILVGAGGHWYLRRQRRRGDGQAARHRRRPAPVCHRVRRRRHCLRELDRRRSGQLLRPGVGAAQDPHAGSGRRQRVQH